MGFQGEGSSMMWTTSYLYSLLKVLMEAIHKSIESLFPTLLSSVVSNHQWCTVIQHLKAFTICSRLIIFISQKHFVFRLTTFQSAFLLHVCAGLWITVYCLHSVGLNFIFTHFGKLVFNLTYFSANISVNIILGVCVNILKAAYKRIFVSVFIFPGDFNLI